jgi:ABC-type phosphate transport system substrate-binding protein
MTTWKGGRHRGPMTRALVAVSALVGGSLAIIGPAGAAPRREVPSAPSGVTATPGIRAAFVRWNAVVPPTGRTITGYRVKASNGQGCRTTGSLSCTVNHLKDGTPYTVKVRDIAGSEKSAFSATVTVTPGLPTAPTEVSAVAGQGAATVSFAASAANGSPIKSYEVTAVDETHSADGGQTATAASSPITITGLTDGDTYCFTVTATNRFGTGAASVPSNLVVPSVSPTLDATGSTFAGVAIQEWAGQVSVLYGLDVNWQVSDSVEGLDQFAQNTVDFAASDFPYSAGQASSTPDQPYQYLPDVASGLSFMFNLIGNNGQSITNLNLDAHVIDQIFLGEITAWNSPSITVLNPQLAGDLPATTITPVYRTDASGESYLLTDYMLHLDTSNFTAAQSAFDSANPGDPTAIWPVPAQGSNPSPTTYPGWGKGNLVGESGSDNAANYVGAVTSDGAITYVETAYAKEHSLPVASLVNASDNDVQPTSANVTTALEAATLNSDLTQNLSNVYTDLQPDAYPLSAYSYLVVPCSPSLASTQGTTCDGPDTASPFPEAKGQALGLFVNYLACAGQEHLSELGYSPLPLGLVQDDVNAIGRINGAAQPPAPTPANCPNPAI